jgi:hypothetical protein
MRMHRASQRRSIVIGVGVARNLEALLRQASEQRRLSGRQRARFKQYARALKTRLDGSSGNQIRVTRRWGLVMLRCLACLFEHSQELRRVAERLMGKA